MCYHILWKWYVYYTNKAAFCDVLSYTLEVICLLYGESCFLWCAIIYFGSDMFIIRRKLLSVMCYHIPLEWYVYYTKKAAFCDGLSYTLEVICLLYEEGCFLWRAIIYFGSDMFIIRRRLLSVMCYHILCKWYVYYTKKAAFCDGLSYTLEVICLLYEEGCFLWCAIIYLGSDMFTIRRKLLSVMCYHILWKIRLPDYTVSHLIRQYSS